MNELSSFHKTECELLHGSLFTYHTHVAQRGTEALKRGLEVLHKLERDTFSKEREEVRERIRLFEELRQLHERLWMLASDIRTNLIHKDGCDCSCESYR